MRRSISIVLTLVILISCFVSFSLSAYALESTGTEVFDNFINDSRFTNGVTWNDDTTPKLSGCFSYACFAYCADFTKYCYGIDDPRTGTKFYDATEIQAGDVIYVKGHWFVCLKRSGNDLYVAEGNYTSKVRIGWTRTIENSGTISGKYIYNTVFQYGYHFSLPLPESGFTDVLKGSWYYDNVRYVVSQGLFNGVGNNKFQPNGTMTREMFVTVLYRLAGEPSVSGNTGFTDVTNTGTWYYNAVLWAKNNDITSGISDTEFGVGRGLKRKDMITLMYRYAQKNGLVSGSPSEDILNSFDDVSKVSSYAKEAMCWAVEKGIITGISGKNADGNTAMFLQPAGMSTRAQVAAVIQRMT